MFIIALNGQPLGSTSGRQLDSVHPSRYYFNGLRADEGDTPKSSSSNLTRQTPASGKLIPRSEEGGEEGFREVAAEL